MTLRFFRLAISPMASTSQALPNTCTRIMARVLGVIAASIFSGAKHQVFGSISVNTGCIPSHLRELAVAMNVKGVVIASGFCPGWCCSRQGFGMQFAAPRFRSQLVASSRRPGILRGARSTPEPVGRYWSASCVHRCHRYSGQVFPAGEIGFSDWNHTHPKDREGISHTHFWPSYHR